MKTIEDELRRGGLTLPPLAVVSVEMTSTSGGPDALIDLVWGDRRCRFAAELKADARPRTLKDAAGQAQANADMLGLPPLLVVPYLSEAKLLDLEAQGINAVDLCGNGVIEAPGMFRVFRSGGKNRFPDSARLTTAYRGDTSLVARAMLLADRFDAVGDVKDLIASRGGNLTIGTVSKAIRKLTDDLCVERGRDPAVRVIDPGRIVDQLTAEYREPIPADTWTGRVELTIEVLDERMRDLLDQDGVKTGLCSAPAYTTFGRGERLDFYVRRPIPEVLAGLKTPATQSSAFANLSLIRTDDQRVYFDARDRQLSSPIQAMLELASGDKRSVEASEPLRQLLVKGHWEALGG